MHFDSTPLVTVNQSKNQWLTQAELKLLSGNFQREEQNQIFQGINWKVIKLQQRHRSYLVQYGVESLRRKHEKYAQEETRDRESGWLGKVYFRSVVPGSFKPSQFLPMSLLLVYNLRHSRYCQLIPNSHSACLLSS